MAIALRGTSSPVIGTAGSTTVTGSEPSGTVQNDVVFALFTVQNDAVTLALPTGWTSVVARSSGSQFYTRFGYVVRGASAPSYAFTLGVATLEELLIWSLSGVDTASVIDNAPTPVEPASSGSLPDPPAATVAASGNWALALTVHWGGSPGGGYGAPTGYTLGNTPTGLNTASTYAYKGPLSSGTEDPGPFTGTPNGSDLAWAETVTVNASTAVAGPALWVNRGTLRLG
jgi:hypothetical protein